MQKPGAKVLYLGAASGTTVSHVSDVVGPVSSFSSTLVLMYPNLVRTNSNGMCLVFRMGWFMQWSFLTGVVEIWSTWPKSEPMLFPSLKMLDTLLSTGCYLGW